MAEVSDGGGKGNKRSVNTELNLVPFIDLMSVLITFLLITAVWTQISMIQIGSSIYGKQQDDKPSVIPPHADIVLRLDVYNWGYRLLYGTQRLDFRKIDGDYDQEGVLKALQQVKRDYPQKIDAVITVEDELPYKALIFGMDVIIKGGFPSISVATGGPA